MKTNKYYQWTVVGAGPAGIVAVGKLLDLGIAAEDILWLDPHFKVGDLGMLWSEVSSNTRVKLFTKVLENIESFGYPDPKKTFSIQDLNPEQTCTLSHIVQPLQWISDRLCKKVPHERTMIHTMHLSDRKWHLSSDTHKYQSKNVILATGAVPCTLDYPGVNVMPFDIAIDKDKLSKQIDKKHTYAVFGSSHSAIIIIRHLVELGVKKVINFYRSPCRYAVDMGDWILFDNTGLKGQTADWAREHIDGRLPHNLERYNTEEHNIARYLPECDQVIYAVGFKQRKNILIGDYEDTHYNAHVGIIGPGLFGLGIAYPELKADPFGSFEHQVGLFKFLLYLNRIMPLWFKYST